MDTGEEKVLFVVGLISTPFFSGPTFLSHNCNTFEEAREWYSNRVAAMYKEVTVSRMKRERGKGYVLIEDPDKCLACGADVTKEASVPVLLQHCYANTRSVVRRTAHLVESPARLCEEHAKWGNVRRVFT